MCHCLLFLRAALFGLCGTTAARRLLSRLLRCDLAFGLSLWCRSYLFLIIDEVDWFLAGSLASVQADAASNNVVNRQNGEFLAMSPAMTVALLRLVLEDNQFLAARITNDGCHDFGILDI